MSEAISDEKLCAIMALPSLYCNHIEWAVTNQGLRFTFGERSVAEGQPPSYRVAVFLPADMISDLLLSLSKSWAEFEQHVQTLAGAGVQGKA